MSLKKKLPKKYNPLIEEGKIFQQWQDERIFRFDTTKKNIFIIDTPPPYTNSGWHMGGAIHYSQIDMIARTMRMKGYELLFPMGLDRNGLPIEIQTEKEFHTTIQETSREHFLQLCNQLLDKYGSQILEITKKLGMSCNSFEWNEIYKTDEEQYRAFTQASFIDLYKQGLIYEDDRPTNWDPLLQTSISDAEIEYKDLQHTLYTIQFELLDSDQKLAISTTRPELLPSIGCIIYNPTDERYTHLQNRRARIPIWNIEIPIIAHPYAKPDFGTGLVMICSFGDLNDIQIFRELQLQPIYSITPQGTLADNAGIYAGLTIAEGRKRIIHDLKNLGVILTEEQIISPAPTNERTGSLIEFIGMKEFYIKQIDAIDSLRKIAHEANFLPDQARKTWLSWLDTITIDWPISRRRFYGTEIPLWYCDTCHEPIIPPKGPYYQPWKDNPPIKFCPHCNGISFTGETRILDTWMDSSNSALYIRSHPENKFYSKTANHSSSQYIADLRVQGKDIIRTWLHFSMLKGELLYKKPMFKTIWISGHIMDNHGFKMSKSRGNIIKPEPIIAKYGADALRLFGASEASLGSDIRFNESKLAGQAKFLTKLYNIAKFISNFSLDHPFNTQHLYDSDKWILSELAHTLEITYQGYEAFDFYIPANALQSYTWDLLSNHYIEMIKARLFSDTDPLGKQSCIWTLNFILKAILKALSPIIPFITEFIYRTLFNESLEKQLFEPIPSLNFHISDDTTQLIKDFNTDIWKKKQELHISLKDSIEIDSFPENLAHFKEDLAQMHHFRLVEN